MDSSSQVAPGQAVSSQPIQRVVTLTMNPALDKSTSTHHVAPEDKLRCKELHLDPGGGGLNVARAIHQLGGEALALYSAGGLNGQVLQNLLQAANVTAQHIPIQSETRESFTVFEETSTHQYRFNLPGPTLTEREWRSALEMVAALQPRPAYVVASGSLPPGAPEDFYVQLAATVADWDARLIVDTSGIPMQQVVEQCAPVYLVKPNMRELAILVGHELLDDDDIVAAGNELLARCDIQVLVVSLGAGGVMMVTNREATFLRAPTVPIRSKIGAGDSTVAGITLGLMRGFSLLEAVRYGVAAGSAAVMTTGTNLCRRDDTERLYAQMQRDVVITR